MDKDSRIFVAGHCGLAGSAICRTLQHHGFTNLVLRTHAELDLTERAAVQRFFAAEKPRYVILAAAKVGGIAANNTFPADFIRENLEIQTHVIEESYRSGVERLLFLGSSCIYPKLAAQPIKEEYLLTGPLEPTNRPYAIAKIAGIEMCWSYNRQYGTRYLAVMPSNLYGPGDNFESSSSHVLASLLRKVMEAMRTGQSEIEVWGTGTPRREFLYNEDLADACVHLMNLSDARYDEMIQPDAPPLINVGCGEDLTIRELADLIMEVLGYSGTLRFDPSHSDGTPRKLLDVSRMEALGWKARTPLREGIQRTHAWARANL